jgi:hypothetical protein
MVNIVNMFSLLKLHATLGMYIFQMLKKLDVK